MIKRTLVSRLFITSAFVVYLFSIGTQHVSAAPYTDSIESIYHVGLDGSTQVEQSINFTRQTSESYPERFSVLVGDEKIYNVRVVSGGVSLESTLLNNEISVVIPQELGVKQDFLIELYYTYDDIVTVNGQLHEISLPVFTSSGDIEVVNQDLSIVTPLEWGSVSFSSQIAARTEYLEDSIITNFSIVPTAHKSLFNIVFGSEQWFNIEATYRLVNNQDVPVQQEIALLPVVENYQDVSIISLEPKPESVRIDQDSNILALYELEPQSKQSIVFTGTVRLYSTHSTPTGSSLEDRLSYTIPDTYWESNDPAIKDILATENIDSAQQIFDYVSSHLTYSSDRALTEDVYRFGALEALKHTNQAVCMEFTDLMIALLRAAGIPAREVNGYTHFSGNVVVNLPTISDELHAWVEYWDDQKGWVFADPTWTSATGSDYFSQFDLRHIVFVRHGISSQYPLSAGAYRDKGDSTRHIVVNVLSQSPHEGTPIKDWVIDMNARELSLWERFIVWLKKLLRFE